MKKILILIVGIALYLHFYPQPELIQLYEDKKSELLTQLESSTKVTFKVNLADTYRLWEKELSGFSKQELSNLKEVLTSFDSVTNFYDENCHGNVTIKLFYADNHDKVCNKLAVILP